MAYVDPDNANPVLVEQLAKFYEASAARLKNMILHPTGGTDSAKAFNQSRTSQLLNQVRQEMIQLKQNAAKWTSKALQTAMEKGIAVADDQAQEAGIIIPNIDGTPEIKGSFALLDRRAIETLARDTAGDLYKAANSMEAQFGNVLRHMAATGVSNAQVNAILAGGIIEGTPRAAQLALKDALEKVHGETVTIQTKRGPRNYDTAEYARMVANSKMKEATYTARHERLQEHGLDLVRIIGSRSIYPCSLLLGLVYSLSGESKKYPAFSSVSEGQEPYHLFHPHCHKSTIPFVEALESDVSKQVAAGLGGASPEERHQALIDDLHDRLRKVGYDEGRN